MESVRERVLAVLRGEEPDKTPLMYFDFLRAGSQGGWMRRLSKRGLGLWKLDWAHAPGIVLAASWIPFYALEDVKRIETHYAEGGHYKVRTSFETPIGTVSCVNRWNPVLYAVPATEEWYVKEPSDWRVWTFIFEKAFDTLAPNYEAWKLSDDEVGDGGLVYTALGKTPFQNAWLTFAGPERAVIDFHEQPEELQEWIEGQWKYHRRIAEIVAGSPAQYVDCMDHITDFTPPKYYREYCIPFYEMYSEALEGTGKVLGIHMDGRFGHLKKEIAEAPFKVIESYTVPPVGDVPLSEARKIWPDKYFFVNPPPDLNFAEPEEIRNAFRALLEEAGHRKGLLFEHTEEIPLERVELYLSAVLDVLNE